jgi:hypothetical protein
MIADRRRTFRPFVRRSREHEPRQPPTESIPAPRTRPLNCSSRSTIKTRALRSANARASVEPPRSIGLKHGGPPGQRAIVDMMKDVPQLDYARPLLRSGIVAGKNQARRTLIIDCPSYWGNSGGPVLEIEQADALTWNFRVMGVVTALVPVAIPPRSSNIAKSGYTIVAPMDSVLSIISQMDKQNVE